MLQAEAIAHRRGVTTLAITTSGSPLYRQVGIDIAADHFENAEIYNPMVSRILHLVIVDILSTTLALRIGTQRLTPLLR